MRKLINIIIVFVYIILLLVMASFAYRKPFYNWDMLGYIGVIIQQDNHDIEKIHSLTYSLAKADVPEIEYNYLLGGEKRKLRADSAGLFYKTLPFYAVKPLYLLSVRIFHKAGFSLPFSTVLPSILAYLLTGVLIFYWLTRHLKIIWAAGIGITMMYAGYVVDAARGSTPDFLSAFFLLSAFFFIIEKPSFRIAAICLAVSMLVRLDNIIICLFITNFLFFTRQWKRRVSFKEYMLSQFLFLCLYFLITYFTLRPYGWDVFYYPSFARHLDLSGAYHSTFSFTAYFSLLYSELITGIVHYHFTFFLFIFLVILYHNTFSFKHLSFSELFTTILFAVIMVRFLLFPDLADRFNLATYLFLQVLFVKKFTGLKGIVNS